MKYFSTSVPNVVNPSLGSHLISVLRFYDVFQIYLQPEWQKLRLDAIFINLFFFSLWKRVKNHLPMKSSFMSTSLSNTSITSSWPGSWVRITCRVKVIIVIYLWTKKAKTNQFSFFNNLLVIITSYISFHVGLRLLLITLLVNVSPPMLILT